MKIIIGDGFLSGALFCLYICCLWIWHPNLGIISYFLELENIFHGYYETVYMRIYYIHRENRRERPSIIIIINNKTLMIKWNQIFLSVRQNFNDQQTKDEKEIHWCEYFMKWKKNIKNSKVRALAVKRRLQLSSL